MTKTMKPELTRDEIDRLFIVNSETGIILNRIDRTYNAKANTEITGINAHGYKRVVINYNSYYAHRIIWTYFYNEKPPEFIDHIDGNKLNNSINNLRAATKLQNNCNRGKNRRNKSGFKGVSWDKSRNKWYACIGNIGKPIYLGRYDTAEEASLVREQKAKELHKEFYYKNI